MVYVVLTKEKRFSLRVIELEVHVTRNKIVFEVHLTEQYRNKQLELSRDEPI